MSFTYNGITSENMGLKVTNKQPPQRAEISKSIITIPGRTEPIFQINPEMSSVDLPYTCEINNLENLRNIFSWLSGKGILIDSDEPEKYYNCITCKLIGTKRISDELREISVTFECSPLAYAVSNDLITISIPTEIYVGGTYFAQPIYKIYGIGDATLKVNQTETPLYISELSDYITIDCGKMIAYKDLNVLTSATSGPFPFLQAKTDNYIDWDGDITKIEIIKNERYL